MRDIEKKQNDLEARGKGIELRLRQLSAGLADGEFRRRFWNSHPIELSDEDFPFLLII